MRLISRSVPAALVAILASIHGYASDHSETVTGTASVPTVLILNVTGTVAMSFAVSNYDPDTGEATQTVTAGSSFRVTTNRGWTLSVKAAAANFTFTRTGATEPAADKPAGDLSFKLTTAGSYTAVTTLDQTLTTGTRGGHGKAGNRPVVDYRLSSTLEQDAPGDYSLALTYTLTST